MAQWTTIIILQSRSLPEIDDWVGEIPDPPPIFQSPPRKLVRAKAQFERRKPVLNFISHDLARRLLEDSHQPPGIEIRYYHAANKTLETIRLRVVTGLEYDACISDGPPSSSPPPPEWPFRYWQSWMVLLEAIAASDIESEWESPSEILSFDAYQPAELISLALSRGILIQDLQSLKVFASFICASRHDSTQSSIVNCLANLHLNGDTLDCTGPVLEGTPRTSKAQGLISSRNHDPTDWRTWEKALSRRCSGESLKSIHPTQSVPTLSGESSSSIGPEEHPGRKFWVWDEDKKRWKKRAEQGEPQWYPESFA